MTNRMNDKSETADSAVALALARELRLTVSQLGRRMRMSQPVGFTSSQLATLGRLDREGPATVTELANAEGIRPQSMGANIAVLEAAGFVRRNADSTDGRKSILSLTRAAKKFINDDRAARADWLYRAISTRLSNPEQAALSKCIELMNRLIDS
jgi:DNA-binding MarR family transcriptional regulator